MDCWVTELSAVSREFDVHADAIVPEPNECFGWAKMPGWPRPLRNDGQSLGGIA